MKQINDENRKIVGTMCENTSGLKLTRDGNYISETIKDADVFINIPALRQYGDYTCGTTCVQMIMNWVKPYENDINLKDIEKELGTTPESGTSGEQIVNYLKSKGIYVADAIHFGLESLRNYLNEMHPVILCMQAWSPSGLYNNGENPQEIRTYLTEGHWVICVGYKIVNGKCLYIFNDPACVGHCFLSEEEFNNRWVDMGPNEEPIYQYAIVVSAYNHYDPDIAYKLL